MWQPIQGSSYGHGGLASVATESSLRQMLTIIHEFFNWMQNKIHGRPGNSKTTTPPLNNLSQQPPRREEFNDWPQSLLTIGTFGNDNLKDQISSNEHEHEQNPTSASSPDLTDFTAEEIGQLQKELTKLLKRKPTKQEDETSDLPLDRFLNCPSSLEVSRRISNALVCTEPECKDDDFERTVSVIIGKCKEVRAEKSKNAIGKKSLSFLLRKLFVCADGFSPVPSSRVTLPETRMEKLLRTILSKKMYSKTCPRTSSLKRRHLQDRHDSGISGNDEDERPSVECKWDKTDSDFIVLEI